MIASSRSEEAHDARMLAQLNRPAHPRACLALLIIGCFAMSGCIRSRVRVSSEPSGAEVIFQGRPRGVTPIDIPIEWYWYYDIAVEKEGYERIETIERFRSPPWFIMPLDLFAELLPIPISDTRRVHYVLEADGEASPPPSPPRSPER